MFRSPLMTLIAALLLSPLCVTATWAATADETATFALREFGELAPSNDAGGFVAGHALLAASYVPRRHAPVAPLPEWHPPLEARYVPRTRYDAVSYRPRGTPRPVDPRVQRWRGVGQLHAGVFDPDGPSLTGFNMGFRAGHELDQMLQIGVGLDWRTKSGVAVPAQQAPGAPVQTNQYSSNLLPVLAYLQLQGPNMLISPYVGVAGSWQVLFLSANDATTGAHYDATYTGWGWQAWAGAGFRVVGRTRLIAEVFMNEGSVGRDIYDPNTYGPIARETIRTDGFGARYGVCWGF